MAFTEEDIEEFRKFLYREPPFRYIGGALSTYPDGDENNRAIYERCEELERRGLVQRRTLDSGTVLFIPIEEER